MNQPEKRVESIIEKKPYEKPDVVYHAPLEVMASDCTSSGKNPGQNTTCDANNYS